MKESSKTAAHDLVPADLKESIPKLGDTRDQQDPVAHIKLFNPAGSWTWFIIEYDPTDRICYGWVCGLRDDFRDFALAELETITLPFGLRIERDLFFYPCPLSKLPRPYRPDIFEE